MGVVRATKNMTIGEDPVAQLYEPLSQVRYAQQRIQFVVRSATPPEAQLAAVRQTLRLAEPAAGLKVETMFSAIGFAFLPSQVGAGLMGSIGALGLLLAVIGLMESWRIPWPGAPAKSASVWQSAHRRDMCLRSCWASSCNCLRWASLLDLS